MVVVKTLAIDMPKECTEFIGVFEGGKELLFLGNNSLSNVKIPTGRWRVLKVEGRTIHLLPYDKEVAIREGWIL